MKCPRLGSLIAVLVCMLAFALLPTTGAAQQPPSEPPQNPPKTQQPNPFEAVPTGKEQQPAPAKQTPFEQVPEGKAETPKTPAEQQPKAAPGQTPNVVEAIEFRGSRRVPQDTLRALIFTKKGDVYNEDTLHRDFMALWNTGRFDDIRMEKEPGPNGWIIRFVVTERPVVRSIKYEGMKSVTVSEILDRFKERKVGLTVESQYDPNKVQRAAIVLKEYLGERGRQFATVDPEIRQIPPSTVEVTFVVNEGPKVKVGEIDFVNNTAFSARELKRSMRNLKPIGIPYSIYFEDLFSKSYDAGKLEEDEDMIRNFYQEHGYFTARVVDTKTQVIDTPPSWFHIPFTKPNKPGKKADLTLTIEEGKLYHLNNINFIGVKLFRTPETLMRPLFQMDKGDVFSTAKLRKGMENMRKLYGEFGYIDFVPEPEPEVNQANGTVDLTFNIDEGKQFFVRRIDFSGNTTTRDKVIRRELLIDEGDMFNSRLWEVSILRLNQLGYFEALKAEEAAVITRDPKNNTVDIVLKVKERGKNSIQLNGGVSGIAGSFIGFSYSTNNFLGLGETLTLEGQLGTRIRNATFGFTEPYLFDKPIQAGFTVYVTRFNYDQGRETSILSGQNLIPLFQSLGSQNLMNYVSTGYGFTTFMSYPLKRSFARVGLSYGFDVSNIDPLTESAQTYFDYLNFQNLSGPNQLDGIKTSRIIPSYSYNTINHPITPTQGRSLYASFTFAGSFLGGNVNMIEPTVDAKYFRPGFKKGHVIGMHFLGRFITGYGGKVAPPFNRFYMGGEQDIRGFQVWSISPVGFIPSSTSVGVYNQDGSQRMQKVISNGQETYVQATVQVPYYQMIWPGGDTQGVANFEYRIPIFGPVILAAFFDIGVDKITKPDQLEISPSRLVDLNSQYPSAGFQSQAVVAPGTQAIRSSTGLELQVLMPVVNAPFRFYWAYNPQRLETYILPPVAADPSLFPNQATYVRALAIIGRPIPWFEKASTFRFSIGRTF
jgi:outer membrane protein insertion porin family